MTSLLRKILIVAATAFALAVPAIQALTGWGLNAGQFAAAGDETLRAASYAFAIWGLIYTGLVAHAVFQLIAAPRHEPLLRRLAPSIIAIAGCGFWLIASGANLRWLSVGIILISAATAWWALHRVDGAARGPIPHVLAVWPVSLLGGWLLIASVINILTVATAEGLITLSIAPAVSLAAIAIATALTVAIVRTGVNAVYGAPVAWGLLAVFVAERAGQPISAYAALAASALVAGCVRVDRSAAGAGQRLSAGPWSSSRVYRRPPWPCSSGQSAG